MRMDRSNIPKKSALLAVREIFLKGANCQLFSVTARVAHAKLMMVWL